MPNWCDNHGSISLPDDASDESRAIFETLARDGHHEQWFGQLLKAPHEMHLGLNYTQAREECLSLEWLQANSAFQGDFGSFEGGKFSPTEDYKRHLTETFGATDWYAWNVKHYGCKWDVNVEVDRHDDGECNFTFDSPWGPPLAFFKFLASKGLNVTLNYREPGQEFCGVYDHTDGETVEEHHEGEDYQVYQLQEGMEDLDVLFWSLQDAGSLEEWLGDNDMPEHPFLVAAITEYFN